MPRRARKTTKKAAGATPPVPNGDPKAAVKEAEAALKAAKDAADKAAAEKGPPPADPAQEKKSLMRLVRRISKTEQSLGRLLKRLTKTLLEAP